MGMAEFGQFAREVPGLGAPHFTHSQLKKIFNEAANIHSVFSDGHRGLLNEEQFMHALRLCLDHARLHHAQGEQILNELCDASSSHLTWRAALTEAVYALCAGQHGIEVKLHLTLDDGY